MTSTSPSFFQLTTMTTPRGLRSPHVECLAVMLSMALTRVGSGPPSAEPQCVDDRAAAATTAACPLPCYCGAGDRRSVRCDAAGLTAVPASVWTVVPLSLNFSFNDVAEWTGVDAASADDTHVSCLGTLILSHCRVARIRPGAFERLRGLRRLRLDHNELAALDAAMLVGLRRLELLDVSHNQLGFLPQSLFDQLKQLKV